MAGEIDKVTYLAQYSALFRSTSHCDTSASIELKEAFIPEEVHGPQDRVLVHAEHGCNVFDEREAFSRPGLALSDCSSDLGCHLIVKRNGLGVVNIDRDHCPSHSSPMKLSRLGVS